MKSRKKYVAGMVLISLFVLAVSLSSLYTQLNIGEDVYCGCAVPPYLFIPFMGSLGLFTGMLIFVLFKDEEKDHVETGTILKLMEENDRKVMEVLFREKEIMQSKIVKKTGLSKVKVSRILKKMEQKGIIEKLPNGNTNLVKLDKKYC